MGTNVPDWGIASEMIRYEALQAKTILNAVKAPSMPFDWSINPYRGCQHGCSFCYARSTHTFLGEAADDTFQRHVFMKTNAAQSLDEQLAKLTLGGRRAVKGGIAIGTATDPYQQAEGKARLTRACLEVLSKYKADVSITTRSPLVLRDLDILRNMKSVSVNISINTLNKTVWRNLEPSTPSPVQRLETVRQLNEAGVPTSVFLAPIVPLLTDGGSDLQEVIHAAAEAGASFVMPSIMRLSTREVKYWFFHCIGQHYPHLTEKMARLYERSAYVPNDYKEPVMDTVKTLLKQHGLSDWDNRRRPAEPPVQLAFSF
ncbi:SPL family radical SAM protein [Paenibacillus alkalitolerans]|uniref:SPL family radical SAM protein n=1 Tax=Paenibacillus alkalitolerans TaxID=2799335 RepID=UPI001F178EE7|nr:radical SAM protein [Paenibacillus alkalitolerans]